MSMLADVVFPCFERVELIVCQAQMYLTIEVEDSS